jgi:FlaA1/EpsC-like NDP-sugar epimerase
MTSSRTVAVMVGAGIAARMLLSNTVLGPELSTFQVVAVLDDRVELHGSSILGVRVLGGLEDLARVLAIHDAEAVIVAVSRRDNDLLQRVLKLVTNLRVRILRTPTYEDLVCGVKINELTQCFDHPPIFSRDSSVEPRHSHSPLGLTSALVTGAGGSIGSEVVRQLAVSGCRQIICLDRDESLLAMSISRAKRFIKSESLELLLADIRDSEALNYAFKYFRPEIVIHAAALKHVSILEKFPIEAWKTNVLGTANVIEAAQSAEIPFLINVSTDKAASPTSALGFSKLITERLVVGSVNRRPESSRKWHSVRFGNVTRSRGSVFETFEQQASLGGPLTVSHPEARRFFISIERAAAFILASIRAAHAAETLVPSMPDEMKIIDIARNIAERFDPVPEIVFSGLKPGEKISEILVSKEDGPVRYIGDDGAVAVRQRALNVDEVLSSRVNPENALRTMRELCA